MILNSKSTSKIRWSGVLVLLVFLLPLGIMAQEPVAAGQDTITEINAFHEMADTIPPEISDTLQIEEKPVHSPMKATMLSVALPGMGQVYNGRAWKVPFIYAGFGTIAWFVDFNNNQYQHFRTNWVARIDGNPNTVDEYPNIPADRLQRIMNVYRRQLEITYILGVALYVLNVLDATVDAHLLDFDVGEDLSMKIRPSLMPANHVFGNSLTPLAGIRFSITF